MDTEGLTPFESRFIDGHRIGANNPGGCLSDRLGHAGGAHDDNSVAIRKAVAIAVVVVGHLNKVPRGGDRAGTVGVGCRQRDPRSRDQDGATAIEKAVVRQTADGAGRIENVQRARRGPAHPVAKSILPGECRGIRRRIWLESIRASQEVIELQSPDQFAGVIEARPGRKAGLLTAFIIFADADFGCGVEAHIESEKGEHGECDDRDK